MSKTAEYERRNLRGFEDDQIMGNRIKRLIAENDIDLTIELGTYLGGTTRRLALMCDHVITVEINLDHFVRAKENLELCRNVDMFYGSSVDVLENLLDKIDKKIFIFIDSHWGENNPLLKELEIIAKSGLKPILGIHDFKVPGHPELGFDTYKNIVYKWEWIQLSIEKIYGVDGFTIEYNSKAEGAMRGIIYIFPK